MVIVETNSPDETRKLGQRIGASLQAGDCLCLTGTLGAGKTLLAQGIAQGMGITEDVTSPTFTVLQIYHGRLPVYHYDLYRLRQPEELLDIGFDEYSGPNGVTLIEWPDKFPEYMPEHALWIEITLIGEVERKIALSPCGSRHESLLKELRIYDNFSD